MLRKSAWGAISRHLILSVERILGPVVGVQSNSNHGTTGYLHRQNQIPRNCSPR